MEDQKHAELEQQSITFLRHRVADDGDCLYASALVAKVAKDEKAIVDTRAIEHLREQVALALPDRLKNQGIVDDVTIEAVLGQSLENYQIAIRDNLWGGEIEISILPEVLCAHIFVKSDSGIERYKYSGDHPNPSLCFIESTGTHFNALELMDGHGINFLSDFFDGKVPVTIVDPEPSSCESSGRSNECSQQLPVEQKRRRNNSPESHDNAFSFLGSTSPVRRVLFNETSDEISDESLSDCEEMDPESACGFPPRT